LIERCPGLVKNICVYAGHALVFLAVIIVVCNQYESLKTLDPFFRITMPALCLLFAFVTTAVNIRVGIMGCLFALPLLPNLTWQIQVYFGYGRILALHNAGFDLITGLFLGAIVNKCWNRKKSSSYFSLPWQAGLCLILLTLSVVLAISRNLHQTVSFFQFSTLTYNLLNFRSIGWHDDYRPLFDWLAYANAFALVGVLVPALKSMPDRNDIIFKPLIISLIIAALVGYRQSTYGVGLSLDQINFRVDQFGYIALGFQQDIHAFAGQMLIGSIGLFGYLYYSKNTLARLLVLAAIPLCWIALFLSKSKSNFALSIVCMIVIAAIWVFRHSAWLKRVLISTLVLVILLALSMVLFKGPWILVLTHAANLMGLTDLAALNVKLSYRPEVYLAALHAFTLFPFMGLGQSEFYRQAANYDLTHSYFLSIDQNGENAHNYFLQTLSETGLIGIAVFTLLLVYPILRIKNKSLLIPAWVGLGAIFIGNIFAHSMLVRENLFTAASFVALMYAWLETENTPLAQKNINNSYTPLRTWCVSHPRVIIVFFSALVLLVGKEIYQSYRRFPFTEDIQCFKAQPLDHDGWTSGLYKVAIPQGAHGMTLFIKGAQPEVAKRPLTATLSIVHRESSLIEQSKILFNPDGPRQITMNFPDGFVADDDDYHVDLRLQRCFIPRNMGINSDGRRLGIQIESSHSNP
jgi:O-antigen ligase